MIENKRFTIDKDGRTILDNIDDSYCECVDGYEAKQYCEKLNAIVEENKELKQLIKKVMDERVVDYPLLCKLKEMVEE